jgi:hypothetical protein
VDNPDFVILRGRGRLKEARHEFARRGWKVLPQGIRGQRILALCACLAWDGYPRNPEAAVRRVVDDLAPYLTELDVIRLISETRVANRRFSNDQCAAILELSVIDCLNQRYRWLGCDDDPDFMVRLEARRERNAACQRRRRAAKRSGRPRGRPKSDGIKPWVACGISRATYYRRRGTGTETENASPDKKRERKVTEFQSQAECQTGAIAKPWEAIGISRRTYFRRKARDGISVPPGGMTEPGASSVPALGAE